MRLQAAIFDMDGLMFDTEPVWASSWPPAFERYGLTVPDGLVESCVGAARERVIRLVAGAFPGNPDALRAVDDHYVIGAELFVARGAPKKPGLDELLAWLADQGVPCAVASSSERRVVEANLGHGGVRELFSVVVTGDDGHPSKPAPDIFLAAAAALGAEPGASVVLEDSPSGVRAASVGGFLTVMVPDLVQPDSELRSQCLAVCRDLLEARDLLSAMAPGTRTLPGL